MKEKPLPPLSRLMELLEVDGEKGTLKWKPRPREMFKSESAYVMWNSRYAGKNAGGIESNGYERVRVDYITYKSHRVIWLMVKGYAPELHLDHINHIRSDNRICNLREVSVSENARNMSLFSNNKSGHPGIIFSKKYNCWIASIKANGTQKHLGCFKGKNEAIMARKNAESQYGYHENCGLNLSKSRGQ